MTYRLPLACLAVVAIAQTADAGLIGATITNPTLQISSNNISVGYNTTSLTTVIDPGTEFVYSANVGNPLAFTIQSADFGDTSLTLVWQTGFGTAFQQTISTFTSTAFAGLTPTVLSTNIPGGLGALSISGNTLTVRAVNFNNPSNNFTATIGFSGFQSSTAVPEPTALAVFGMIGLAAVVRRRRFSATA